MTKKKHRCQCMASVSDSSLSTKILNTFLPPTPNLLRSQTSTTLPNVIPNFTVFDKVHMKQAQTVVQKLVDAPLEEALSHLSALRATSPDLSYCEYISRRVFAVREDTRNCPLPPSYQTNPTIYFTIDLHTSDDSILKNTETGTDLDPEHKVAWWREDIGLCSHHENWHLSYPYYEPPRDRQGELFAYMHQQMVGRYDCERLAIGLDRVRAFGPGYCWDEGLIEGYNPHMKSYSVRPRGIKVDSLTRRDTRRIINDEIIRNKDIIFTSLAKGRLESEDGKHIIITIDRLGCLVESNKGSVNAKMYGNLHNDGHLLLGYMTDPDGRFKSSPGVMINNCTATRDPVFFRWHKFIDSIFEAHRTSLPDYTVPDLTFSGVKLNKIEVQCEDTSEVNRFTTYMERRVYTVYNVHQGTRVETLSLNHLPFSYNIRLTNENTQTVKAVIRLFLSPASDLPLEEWRNMFIELDKFVVTVGPGEQTVTRRDVESSVILPPTVTVEDMRDVAPGTKPVCGCGWPLHLLIPRGTNKGMKVKLFGIVTDWTEDRADPSSELSGSVSYCGKSGSEYPDKRSMGFPFDRTTSYTTVEDLVNDIPNSFVTNAKIVFMDDEVINKAEHQQTGQSTEELTPTNNFEFVLI